MRQYVQIGLPSRLWILFFTMLVSITPNRCSGGSCTNAHPQSRENRTLHPIFDIGIQNLEPIGIHFCPCPTPAFTPRSSLLLKNAVDKCLKMSPKGNCFGFTASNNVERVRLVTTTDSAGAAAKIVAAAKPVTSVAAVKQEPVTSFYMWKGELNKDAGNVFEYPICVFAYEISNI